MYNVIYTSSAYFKSKVNMKLIFSPKQAPFLFFM